jgi:hypothetical protein
MLSKIIIIFSYVEVKFISRNELTLNVIDNKIEKLNNLKLKLVYICCQCNL